MATTQVAVIGTGKSGGIRAEALAKSALSWSNHAIAQLADRNAR